MEKLSIGVIGSGVAGAFTAHFIRKQLGPDVEVTVFERDWKVGGRVNQIVFGGLPLEAGGAAIHSSNRYLVEAIDASPFRSTSSVAPKPGQRVRRNFGVWNGETFDVIAGFGDHGNAVLFGRYGENLLRIERLVRQAVEGLSQIYARQEQGESFVTPEALFQSLGLYSLTQIDGYTLFRRESVDDAFAREMSDGISRGNYGQCGKMNAFASLISLAGGGFGPGSLFSVVEGNARLFERLIEEAGARLLVQTAVRRIEAGAVPGRRYTLVTDDGWRFPCDAVVIAAPLELTGIDFNGIPLEPGARIKREYQTTHVTFVEGRIDPRYFGLETEEEAPDLVLTRESPDIPFSTVGFMGKAEDGLNAVYKIFSREAPDEALLDAMFAVRVDTLRLVWKAYPVLEPMAHWPPFRLGAGLYHVNAMESPVSTMETEAIAARNVVNLIAKECQVLSSLPERALPAAARSLAGGGGSR